MLICSQDKSLYLILFVFLIIVITGCRKSNEVKNITYQDDTDYLAAICDKSKIDSYEEGYCNGIFDSYRQNVNDFRLMYGVGFWQAAEYYGQEKEKILTEETVEFAKAQVAEMYGCLSGKTAQQLATGFVEWVKSNPNKKDKYLVNNIKTALKESFPAPCK